MIKNKKGFTLVELLAVIVVLAIIMSIAGGAILKQKKRANQKEVESIYKTIKEFGPDVYNREKNNIKDNKTYFDIGYLNGNNKEKDIYLKTKDIKNPLNPKNNCKVYLLIDRDSDNMFDAYVDCDGLEAEGTNPIDNGYSNFSKQ